jgi:hypothetical protein
VKISAAFPSNYLKAADLNDRNVKVVMDRVEMEDIGGDHKPILYFQGKEKGLVLNKTNSNNISAAYGDDTDGWTDHELILYPAMTDFQGKTVPCIRVRAPTAKDRPQAAARPAPRSENPADDSDIPF